MENKSDNSLKHKHSLGLIIFRIASLIIIIVSLLFLYNWNLENKMNEKIISQINSQINIPDITKPIPEQNNNNESSNNSKNDNAISSDTVVENTSIDFSYLYEINKDTIGWIKINNTDVSYPIVKAQDNDYYLNHSFNKEYNSAGWIFADYRNSLDFSDKNTIIYGHNRRNGSMFSTLNETIKESWYTNPENKYITIYTPSETYTYEIFSIYKISQNKFDNRIEFSSNEEYQKYISDLLSLSIYNFNVNVDYNDNILTVYTCANNNKYRIVIHAKK